MRMRCRTLHLPGLRDVIVAAACALPACVLCAPSRPAARTLAGRARIAGPRNGAPQFRARLQGGLLHMSPAMFLTMATQQLEDGDGAAVRRLAGAAAARGPLPGTDNATGRDGLVPPGRTPCLKVAGPCGPGAARAPARRATRIGNPHRGRAWARVPFVLDLAWRRRGHGSIVAAPRLRCWLLIPLSGPGGSAREEAVRNGLLFDRCGGHGC